MGPSSSDSSSPLPSWSPSSSRATLRAPPQASASPTRLAARPTTTSRLAARSRRVAAGRDTLWVSVFGRKADRQGSSEHPVTLYRRAQRGAAGTDRVLCGVPSVPVDGGELPPKRDRLHRGADEGDTSIK